jgi:hypothetical protein
MHSTPSTDDDDVCLTCLGSGSDIGRLLEVATCDVGIDEREVLVQVVVQIGTAGNVHRGWPADCGATG